RSLRDWSSDVCSSDLIPAPPFQRLDDQTWRVNTRGMGSLGRFIVSYKVFANDLSGTFSQLDAHHANFNGGCVFVYVVNHKQDPRSEERRVGKECRSRW